MTHRPMRQPLLLALTTSLSALVLFIGCSQQHDPSPKEIPQAPLLPVKDGVAFTVVSDKTLESRKQTEVQAALLVPKGTTYTPIQPLLRGLYQQVALRDRGFHYRKHPNAILVKIYDDQAKAAAGGEGALAELRMRLGQGAPEFITHIPLELDKQVIAALGPQPEFGKTLRPKTEVDEAQRAVTYRMPYVIPGDDKYVESLAWGDAVMGFSGIAQKIFKGVPTLKSLTFIGDVEGKEVIKIQLTAEQMKEINLPGAEHRIADALGNFSAQYAQQPNFEAKYKKENDKVRRAELKPVLDKLPKEQVTITLK